MEKRSYFRSRYCHKLNVYWLVSTYVVCERLSVMHKQVCVRIPQTVNLCPNSPESPFLEFQTREPPPQWKTSDLRWPKFTLWNTPPPKWKTSDLRWPKFTPEYPPKMKNFRFEMTKVYSGIPPPPPWARNLVDRMWRLNLYPPWIPSRCCCSRNHLASNGKSVKVSGRSRISQTEEYGATSEVKSPTYYLAKYLLKTAWKWKKLDLERGIRTGVLDPPMRIHLDVLIETGLKFR